MSATDQQATIQQFLDSIMDEIADRVVLRLAEQPPAPEPDQDRLLTLAEVGEMLGVSERTVRDYVGGDEPWLPSVRIGSDRKGGGSVRVWLSALKAKIAESR